MSFCLGVIAEQSPVRKRVVTLCRVVSRDRLQVRASPAKGRSDVGFPLQALLTRLPEVVVHGIPTVQRAVINRQADGRFQLFAEGTDLRVSFPSTSKGSGPSSPSLLSVCGPC